jgi:hypothetical protein
MPLTRVEPAQLRIRLHRRYIDEDGYPSCRALAVRDRGFQIFLTGYPTAKEELDFQALDLKPFYSGALVRFQGALHR